MAQCLGRLERGASARGDVPHIECVLRPAKAAVTNTKQLTATKTLQDPKWPQNRASPAPARVCVPNALLDRR